MRYLRFKVGSTVRQKKGLEKNENYNNIYYKNEI